MSKLAAMSMIASAPLGMRVRPQKNETVVTGNAREAKEGPLPSITFIRRADAIIATLTVSTESGDYFDRLQELRRALRQIETRSARNNRGVGIAFLKGNSVLPFTMTVAEAAIIAKAPPETSQAALLLRTPILALHTIDTAMGRIYAFRNDLQRPPRLARIEYSLDSVSELTVAAPGQYRATVLESISKDVHKITKFLGEGYAARIIGLEQRMVWRRATDLEINFFIPYRMEIRPAG